MPYWMKFSINLYNLVQSTRIMKNNRFYRLSLADNLGLSRVKAEKKVTFSDFDLHYLAD